MVPSYVAIDLGAGSGRVVRADFGDLAGGEGGLELEVLHRFANEPRRVDGHDRWDVTALFDGILTGLRRCGREVRSIGVDTWGVDYGLFGATGALLEDPICYRDHRTDKVVQEVFVCVPRAELFARTGLQVQQFNTIYQLFAHVHDGPWAEGVAQLLMMPDVFHSLLCGSTTGELTMATTSQLVSAGTAVWDSELFARLGLPLDVMPELVAAGTELGTLRPELQRDHGLPALRVVAPATHDTASAVAGTPLRDGWAYISSGTWSLVGVETDAPVMSDAVAAQNLTNEGGAEGTNRLLQNVMGLWMLESCRRCWRQRGAMLDYPVLQRCLAAGRPFAGFVDPGGARFFNPDDMVEEVRSALRESGQQVPGAGDEVTLSRIVLESLAMCYATALRALEQVTGRRLKGVHIIGGGSQNAFLNQATADATGLAVLAGPVEATAIGNVLVQAIADGCFADLGEARSYVQDSVPPQRFEPQNAELWGEARLRYLAVEGGGQTK